MEKCAGGDFSIACPPASFQLANHYGDLRLANWYMDQCMQFVERMLVEESPVEAFTLLFAYGYWGYYATLLSRQVRRNCRGDCQAHTELTRRVMCTGAVPGGAQEGEARLE